MPAAMAYAMPRATRKVVKNATEARKSRS